MNRMEKPNKAYVSKPRKRFGIFCLIMDAVYVILGLSFYNYSSLPSFYQKFLSYVWIGLMAAALIAALVGIFTSKEYELFRTCMFETVILAAQGVWLGASSSLMLVKNQQAPFPMYFLIGVFCLLGVGLLIQIDAIWFRSIMHFMMRGGENMVEIETPAESNKAPDARPAAVVRQGTVTLDTSHLKRSTVRRQTQSRTQAQPRVQVIDQNEARTAVKQAQAKARAKQALAEDFEKRSRSTSRTPSKATARQTAQPRRTAAPASAQNRPERSRERIFEEQQQKTQSASRTSAQRPQTQHTSRKPVQAAAPQPRVRAQRAENQQAPSPRPSRQTRPASPAAADMTMKWEPNKVRQAEASARRAAQLEALKARKAAMRTTPPSSVSTSSTSASDTSSRSETPQWATQRKRRPKTHHYGRSSSHLFIRDDDQDS